MLISFFYSKLQQFLAKSYSSQFIGISVNISTLLEVVNWSDFVRLSWYKILLIFSLQDFPFESTSTVSVFNRVINFSVCSPRRQIRGCLLIHTNPFKSRILQVFNIQSVYFCVFLMWSNSIINNFIITTPTLSRFSGFSVKYSAGTIFSSIKLLSLSISSNNPSSWSNIFKKSFNFNLDSVFQLESNSNLLDMTTPLSDRFKTRNRFASMTRLNR